MAEQNSRTASRSDTGGTSRSDIGGASPFDTAAIERRDDGVPHYTDLPANLVAMLRNAVDEAPDAEAIVEYGAPDGRLTYVQLWDRATRVAGGLRDAGVARGDRVAL